jgi:5-methyltetrahydrofolate--homocysteine methyltransferase
MMLQGAGLQVVNLGVDVEPDAFVKAVKEQGADILGMSSLLTTAMRNMTTTMEMLAEEGVRDNLKVMVGGAAITPSFAERIGADAYGDDANGAVRIAREWCK